MNADASPMPVPDLAGILRRPASTAPADSPSGTSAGRPGGTDTRVSRARGEGRPEPRGQTRRADASVADEADRVDADHPQPAATGKQYLRPIAVYLPRSLHEKAHRAKEDQGTTATALMLTAVNSKHPAVADALAKRASGDGSPGLFAIPQARRPVEPTVQTTIRVTDSQFEALNRLAAEYGVNRSVLISTALDLFLS